ncbi:MAG: cation diffusion facilitator family transporter [Methylophilaceae bacterium]
MSGSHSHGAGISSNKMWFATAITFAFCLGEALIGYKSNSLALMADAGHNFADALALALSAFALWIATKPADSKRTFGYHRVGILAALVNAVGLVVMAIVIFWEAIQRLQTPEHVQSGPMIWVALLAIVLNSGIAWWLASAAKEDLNIRSAYLHMLGDAAASLGVVIAGIIIAFTSWFIADPIVSIIFALLVLWSSWSIFTESIQMLLEGIPVGMELNQVEQAIREVKGVLDVHDLHVWTVSSGLIACNCHILVAEQNVSAAQKIQAEVAHELEHDFKISHSTIQIEVEDCGGHDHTTQSDHEHEHKHKHGH